MCELKLSACIKTEHVRIVRCLKYADKNLNSLIAISRVIFIDCFP